MKFDISELLKKKNDELTFELSFDENHLDRDDYRLNLKSPLKIKGKAVNNSDIVEVTGVFSVLVEVQCTRCLEVFEHFFNVDFEETFSKSLENEEFYQIIEGDLIFDEMVMDNLILSMPVRLLCNEECKGLCHNCGVNLNKVDCDCEKETVNPKFAALKELFKQN
jgi:uncharacterized protein